MHCMKPQSVQSRVHAFLPGGEVSSEARPSELSPKCSLLSCRATCLCPLSSNTFKTEGQVLSIIPEPGLAFSHLLRTPRHASSQWSGLSAFTVSITEGSTPRWVATCSQSLATELTMSFSSWGSVGFELMLRRMWVPEKPLTDRKKNTQMWNKHLHVLHIAYVCVIAINIVVQILSADTEVQAFPQNRLACL